MSCTNLVSKFLKLSLNSQRYSNAFHLSKLSAAYVPYRERHGLLIRKNFDNYWVPRKRPLTDDKLTSESKEFLQEVIHDKYLQPGESPLCKTSEERRQWTPESRRTGLIVRKIGVHPMWTKTGKKVIATLLQVVDNHVIRYNPPEIFEQSKYAKSYKETGVYGSLVVGAESADPQLFTAAYNGLFAESGVMPKKKLTRFRITPDAALEPGTALFATHFKVGQYVNVYGISTYHGFQGVMKRWDYKGMPKTHGVTKSHRRGGCISAGRKDGVWKGKKMPGLHGGWRRLICGLKVLRINTKHNVIYVIGRAVPGVINNYCFVYDSNFGKKKHSEDNPPPFPTFYPGDIENMPEEYYDEEIHKFGDPSIVLEDKVEEVKVKVKK